MLRQITMQCRISSFLLVKILYPVLKCGTNILRVPYNSKALAAIIRYGNIVS
jgi:hypothetical protein